ncbi:MAG: hypothetical protein ED557_13305 [Balneola sp.]|nr:MAG: hypothetical protein ED557_13305 [Balneola sp.]
MKSLRSLLAVLVVIFGLGMSIIAQEAPAYAISDVTIHHSDGTITESGTIVWRNGIIEAIGSGVNIPFDAFKVDLGDSLHIYPGFIDGFTTWGSPRPPTDLERLPRPGEPPYDRAGVQPERVPSEMMIDDKDFEAAIKAGFTTAALGFDGNMLSGKVEIFTLSPKDVKANLFGEEIALHGSFSSAPGGWSTGAYPSTQMGVMAKFRQVMYDAEALKTHMEYHSSNPEMPAPERSDVLEAMFPLIDKSKPLFFSVDTKENIERMFSYQDEFGFDIVIVSGKEAYARADELKERNIPVLASVDITEAPEWHKAEPDTSKEAEELSEEEQHFRDKRMAAWKDEVMNIKMLMDAGVQVGYSSFDMALKDLPKKVTLLVEEGGLTEEDLVKLMTTNTAQILGIDDSFGELKVGMNASFTVFDKPMMETKAKSVSSVSNGNIVEF